MGEVWHSVWRVQPDASIVGIDLSSRMCAFARKRHPHVNVLQTDALESALPDASFDTIVCSFGLKTLSDDQQQTLAREITRLLKPGGHFAALEISVPPTPLLRWPYMMYLRRIIPAIGRLCLGNPDCYRMLGIYTERFGSAERFAKCFDRHTVDVTLRHHFFGCATSVAGIKRCRAARSDRANV
jgi:demethylmenaquinone methyltransferase/2-methoxy-6-polyprenyl-1,4-benzoquinol methylase